MLLALALTLWAIFCIFDTLGPSLVYASRPLIAGTVAGLIVGNLPLGLAIGATLEFAALGSYTYGGSSTPDWPTGAIIGIAVASISPGSMTQQVATGVTIAVAAALVLTPLDPIGRTLTTFWIHRADVAAVQGRTRELTILHWTAFIPWAAVRAIPTFLITYFLNQTLVGDIETSIPAWLVRGLTLAGAMLPAVGFAMLLKLLPVRKYWYFLLIGFVLFAYMNVPVLGIALFGVAIAIMFVVLKPAAPTAAVATGVAPSKPGPATATTTTASSEQTGETSNV
jgi:mannose/fructose/N-acetylgalactosamine-specific phosphotransferase system component IIC